KKPSPQEKKRQQLLDELGLKPADKPVPPPPPLPAPLPGPAEGGAPPPSDKRAPEAEKPGVPAPGGVAPAAPPGPSFRRVIHPQLMQTCQVCHRPGGPAQATHLLLGGDAAVDYATVRAFVSS